MKYLLIFLLIPIFSLGQTVELITTTGTWTCPAGVTSVQVECWGAGGSGSVGLLNANTSQNPYGGGGGGYSRSTLTVIPGNIYGITVAPQANGNTSGGNYGTPSIFSYNSTELVKATGGWSGYLNTPGTNTNDVDGIGDVRYKGGSGGAGYRYFGYTSDAAGGAGGGAAGSTGNGKDATGYNTYVAGAATSEYGGKGGNARITAAAGNIGAAYGGGGGGGLGNSTTTYRGGHGYAGLIRLTYTVSGGTGKKWNGATILKWNGITPIKINGI